MTTFPNDYAERVYAGVLGKIIGVYLGRPFEGWSCERLTERFGEIDRYVHEDLGQPLIVADDDISGTFTFLRAIEDYGFDGGLTPQQIGQTWLNYLIEGKTVLWWGGLGVSTEHTAYIRLKQGHKAPESGSIALNGRVVAEQIGAQIFIDGWGMINPGDPERAADFARRAASVSHDGEAIYGAQLVAALVAAAFVEQDIDKLLDTAISFIPRDSIIFRMIEDIRAWQSSGEGWRATRQRIDDIYGYKCYGGGCHMVPNHALIILSLLAGGGSFSESLKIVNTCGWDTDCNSGNVGAIMGVRNGLAGLDDSVDWRGPVADRLYLPTADGGRCVTDAVQEAVRVINAGLQTAGQPAMVVKGGAKFSFAFPGSVQGFLVRSGDIAIGNPDGAGLQIQGAGRIATMTYPASEMRKGQGYSLAASPTLYSGQTVRAKFAATKYNTANVQVSTYIESGEEETVTIDGPSLDLAPGQAQTIEWIVPDTGGEPVTWIGAQASTHEGVVTLDWLTWDGAPSTSLLRPATGEAALSTWASSFHAGRATEPGSVGCVSNEGRGMAITGTREWRDYTLTARITPHLAATVGIAARMQGLERYYALLLNASGQLQLIKRLDGERVLAHKPLAMELDHTYAFSLTVAGNRITGVLDGEPIFDVTDEDRPLETGAVGLIVDEGSAVVRDVVVRA